MIDAGFRAMKGGVDLNGKMGFRHEIKRSTWPMPTSRGIGAFMPNLLSA